MKRIMFIGLATLTVCATSVVLATAAAAHEFNATSMGALTAKAVQTQRFVTTAGSVECTVVNLIKGEAVLKALNLPVTLQYENCTVFGTKGTMSPALYRLNADGTVSIVSTITATATGCTMTIPSGKNQNLSSFGYRNSGLGFELLPSVKGITSSGVGTLCGYAEESTGRYFGPTAITLASGAGSVSWS